MKRILFVMLVLLLIASNAVAGWVKGYYRSNGTYVSGHYRSAPDNSKWNNYGPSKSSQELSNPYTRDNDKDGVPNYLDRDDDNDGVSDDNDNNQYGR